MEKLLPKGWVETELGSFAYLKNGFAYKTTQFKDSGIPILKISNITKDGKVDISNPQYVDESLINEAFLVKSGDIVIAMSGATTGKFGVYNSNDLLLQNQRVGNIKLQKDSLGSKKFLYYLIASLRKEIEDRAYGGAQPNISSTLIENIQIPLPPLAEQERIVAKLDKLFAQHEKMKKALDRIPQLLKTFRQQMLTQAVTGKLTKQWREGKKLKEWNPTLKKHNTKNLLDDKSQGYVLPEIPKEWKWVTIMQLADVKGGKRLPKGEKLVNYDTGFPYIKAGDIKNGNVNSVNLEYLLEATHEKIKNYIVNSGDILITNVGACIGDIGIVPTNLNGANQTENALKLCNFVEVQVKYLSFWLRSPIAQNYISQTVLSAGLGKLALGRIQVFPVPLSTIVEQQEIVHRVESLFAKADAIEGRYQTLKAKVDKLPQAILHKAFKGELVPQLPTDGDAKDLLEEIMALKAEPKGKKRK